MSVIVRLPEENNRICLMCKGADSTIDKLLIKNTCPEDEDEEETPYT